MADNAEAEAVHTGYAAWRLFEDSPQIDVSIPGINGISVILQVGP